MSTELVLVGPDQLNSNVCETFKVELERQGVPVRIKLEPPKVYASLLWAVPSVLAVYLAKPFIETVLKKAAEDSYPAIKVAFQKLAESVFKKSAIQEPKISLTLALYFERQQAGWVKALLWEGISRELQEEALEKLFSLINKENFRALSPEQLRMWSDLEAWGTVFICFDLNTKTWKPIDIVDESRRKQDSTDRE